MRFIGIDYGRARIGIAVSDEAGSFAFPRMVVANDEKAVGEIARLAGDEKAGAIVVGDARAFSGEENRITPEADAFAAKLAAAASVPVHRGVEAWSSVEAARYAPNGKKHDDAAAAAIILQRFLDMKGRNAQN